MKRLFFAMFFLFLGYMAAVANPMDNVRGLVSYSETQTLYFDSEQNALRWIETQTDFMNHRELPEGQRRLVETMVTNMIPNFQDLVRLHSDFSVMIERSATAGESTLQFYIQGRLVRLWTY